MACVDYGFYRDAYGGQMTPEALAGALPAACALVRWLCCGEHLEDPAYRRAVCAAADVFGELGTGGAQSFTVGSFRMGGSGGGDASAREPAELAVQAALRELTGAPAAFTGAR